MGLFKVAERVAAGLLWGSSGILLRFHEGLGSTLWVYGWFRDHASGV